MLRLSLRLYLTANLLVYAVFAVWFFPEGLGLGLIALLFSSLVSSPAVVFLLLGTAFIETRRPKPLVSWLILTLTVALCSAAPVLILNGGDLFRLNELLLISGTAGFGSLLLQSVYLHNTFKRLCHENN